MDSQYRSLVNEILELTGFWEEKLRKLPGEKLSLLKNKQDRSIKQIVGHMVDSATNNTHRMVHLQYQDSPIHYPDYANLGNNDRWITIQDYQEEDWKILVDVWSASHRHIAHVITRVNSSKLGQVWISALGEEVTLQEMIEDFPRHFKLHLGEILELLETK
jgi:hypothetical protein